MNIVDQNVIPFLTFNGVAKEAMDYYVSIFPKAKIINTTYFKENQRGEVGKVLNGTFEVMGINIMVMDMEKQYCPDFSWATTLLLNMENETDFDDVFNNLSKGGTVMMGPEEIEDIRKVAWVTDKFNVTWQMIWK